MRFVASKNIVLTSTTEAEFSLNTSVNKWTEVFVLTLVPLLWVAWVILNKHRHHRLKELGASPPGPRWWPVVGNIFQFGWEPHKSFSILSQKHGPIMTLWLGSMRTVVISSDEVAREMFKNHDTILAGRKIYEAMKGNHGNEGSLITAQYGPHWRMLRRLCTSEFFAASRLDAMRGIRSNCIDRMVQFMENAGDSGTNLIDVGRFFFLMAFNLIGNLLFSKDLLDPKSERGAKFFYHAGKVMELAGQPNVADFLPLLRWFDPQGIRRKTQFHVNRAFDIAGEFLKERVEKGSSEDDRKDYLDVLLEHSGDGVEGPARFSSRTINVIVFEMFTAGTDTTTSTLEWAMAELLHNRTTLRKVQAELRKTISPDKKLEEKDIDKLPYLKAVIKETLRLHPPLPFLVPHMAMDSCNMLGYNIPKETQILVNVWAIGRDRKKWKDPLEFKPQRFLEPNMLVDFKGHHFEFIPFGSGRRMCPALPLAARVLPLALGSVLHKFDWLLADGAKGENMDMSERMGITLRKAVPLQAIPIPYKGNSI
uniref:Cytochrome P450 n=1 Tax=Nothapodytes nimmoniana TaxID=159386 RepID=A0A7L7RBB7_NOTNI|nr:cytochrome P450 [Nothapodytes nimmoniana]